MAKFTDFYSSPEVTNIMKAFIEKFPAMFEGFDIDGFEVLITRTKKSNFPVKLHTLTYPRNASATRPYIVEVFETWWAKMDQRQKNTSVFHIMCAIPPEAFDETSKMYGKKLKPELSCYMLEFAATGGVPNWMENPLAMDPMERNIAAINDDRPDASDPDEPLPESATEPETCEDGIQRIPVTTDAITSVVPAVAS